MSRCLIQSCLSNTMRVLPDYAFPEPRNQRLVGSDTIAISLIRSARTLHDDENTVLAQITRQEEQSKIKVRVQLNRLSQLSQLSQLTKERKGENWSPRFITLRASLRLRQSWVHCPKRHHTRACRRRTALPFRHGNRTGTSADLRQPLLRLW